MVEAVAEMLREDFTRCKLVTREEVGKRQPLPRFIAQAARLFSPVL
jgi:cardiolipin synthase